MNSKRQASTFAIALLMAGLVIVVGLSAASITTEPEDLPWSNETDVIILPPPPPLPINNETDVVIIVTDPHEELNLKIDRIDAELISLQDNIEYALDMLVNEIVTLFDGGLEMHSRIDVLETSSNEVNEQIESLENKISRLQTTIIYACIATAIIAILCAFLLIKRMK